MSDDIPGGPTPRRPDQGVPPGLPMEAPSSAGQVVVPDQAMVCHLLDQMELKWLVDDEGDLVAAWEQFRTYYMFRGEAEQQVFSVRTFYDRVHGVDAKPLLLDTVDDWHRRTLWPKVYTHRHDDGSIRLIGESQILIAPGVNLEYFVASVVGWTRAAVEFDKWLVESLELLN